MGFVHVPVVFDLFLSEKLGRQVMYKVVSIGISESCHQMDYVTFKQIVIDYVFALQYGPLSGTFNSVIWRIGRISLKGALTSMIIHKNHTLMWITQSCKDQWVYTIYYVSVVFTNCPPPPNWYVYLDLYPMFLFF